MGATKHQPTPPHDREDLDIDYDDNRNNEHLNKAPASNPSQLGSVDHWGAKEKRNDETEDEKKAREHRESQTEKYEKNKHDEDYPRKEAAREYHRQGLVHDQEICPSCAEGDLVEEKPKHPKDKEKE
jgi:hypothetical protein